MKNIQRPVLMTLLFGLVCGISYIPLNLALNMIFWWPMAIHLTLWLFSTGYGLLMGHWSKNKISPILFPLLILLLAAFLVESAAAFFLFALAIISWIRSGICFQVRAGINVVVEILLCATGGILVAAYTPGSPIAWVLGTWLFFLLQALYFVVYDPQAFLSEEKHDLEIDPFERASKRAEEILSTGLYPD